MYYLREAVHLAQSLALSVLPSSHGQPPKNVKEGLRNIKEDAKYSLNNFPAMPNRMDAVNQSALGMVSSATNAVAQTGPGILYGMGTTFALTAATAHKYYEARKNGAKPKQKLDNRDIQIILTGSAPKEKAGQPWGTYAAICGTTMVFSPLAYLLPFIGPWLTAPPLLMRGLAVSGFAAWRVNNNRKEIDRLSSEIDPHLAATFNRGQELLADFVDAKGKPWIDRFVQGLENRGGRAQTIASALKKLPRASKLLKDPAEVAEANVLRVRQAILGLVKRVEELAQADTSKEGGGIFDRMIGRFSGLLESYEQARKEIGSYDDDTAEIEAWQKALEKSGVKWNPRIDELRKSGNPEKFVIDLALDLVNQFKKVLAPNGFKQPEEWVVDTLLKKIPDLANGAVDLLPQSLRPKNFRLDGDNTPNLSLSEAVTTLISPHLLREFIDGEGIRQLDQKLNNRQNLHSGAALQSIVLMEDGETVWAASPDLQKIGIRAPMRLRDAQKLYIDHYANDGTFASKARGLFLTLPNAKNAVIVKDVDGTHYVVGVSEAMKRKGITTGMTVEEARGKYQHIRPITNDSVIPAIKPFNVIDQPATPLNHPLHKENGSVNIITTDLIGHTKIVRGTTPAMALLGIKPGMRLEHAQELYTKNYPADKLQVIDLRANGTPNAIKQAYPNPEKLAIDKIVEPLRAASKKLEKDLLKKIEESFKPLKDKVHPKVYEALKQMAIVILKVLTWPIRFVVRQYALHYLGLELETTSITGFTRSIEPLIERVVKNTVKTVRSPAIPMLIANWIENLIGDITANEKGLLGTKEETPFMAKPIFEAIKFAARIIKPDDDYKSPKISSATVKSINWIAKTTFRIQAKALNTSVVRKVGSLAGKAIYAIAKKGLDFAVYVQNWASRLQNTGAQGSKDTKWKRFTTSVRDKFSTLRHIGAQEFREKFKKYEPLAMPYAQEGLGILSDALHAVAEEKGPVQATHKFVLSILGRGAKLGLVGDYSRYERKGGTDLANLIQETIIAGATVASEGVPRWKMSHVKSDWEAFQVLAGKRQPADPQALQARVEARQADINRKLQALTVAGRPYRAYLGELPEILKALETNLSKRQIPEALMGDLQALIPQGEEAELLQKINRATRAVQESKGTPAQQDQAWKAFVAVAKEVADWAPRRLGQARARAPQLTAKLQGLRQQLARLKVSPDRLFAIDFANGRRAEAKELLKGAPSAWPARTAQAIQTELDTVQQNIANARSRIKDSYSEDDLDQFLDIDIKALTDAVNGYREHGDWWLEDLQHEAGGKSLPGYEATEAALQAELKVARLQALVETEKAAVSRLIGRTEANLTKETRITQALGARSVHIAVAVQKLPKSTDAILRTLEQKASAIVATYVDALKTEIRGDDNPFADLIDVDNELAAAENVKRSIKTAIATFKQALAHKNTTGIELEVSLDTVVAALDGSKQWAKNHLTRLRIQRKELRPITAEKLKAEELAALKSRLPEEQAKSVKAANEKLVQLQERLSVVAKKAIKEINQMAGDKAVQMPLDQKHLEKHARRWSWKQHIYGNLGRWATAKANIRLGWKTFFGERQRNYATEILREMPEQVPALRAYQETVQRGYVLRRKLFAEQAKLHLANLTNPLFWFENRKVVKPVATAIHGGAVRTKLGLPIPKPNVNPLKP